MREILPFMATPSSSARRLLVNRLVTPIVAVILIATVASCRANIPSPCGLLTVEEIENEVGTKFDPPGGDEELDSGGLLCVWIPVPSSPSTDQVSLSIHQFSSSDWDAIGDTDGSRSVGGLGQAAYFVPGPVAAEYDPFGTGLHVQQDGLQLTLLGGNTAGQSEAEEILVELARLALTQMSKLSAATAPPQAPQGRDR